MHGVFMIESLTQYGRIYSDPPERIRTGSRAIIVKENKILLSYEVNTDVYMSPGGGLEAGETLDECCVRELREEAGYEVAPLRHFLVFNEYWLETLYVNNYFICEIIGKCDRSLTEIEVEHGITPVWVDIDEALRIFGDYASKREDVGSLYRREFAVINKFLEQS